MNSIRHLAEDCNNLQGFVVFHSTCGGTGSGLSTRLLDQLSHDYPKLSKVGFTILPSGKISHSAALNTVLSSNALIGNLDVCLTFDNEAISNIYANRLDVVNPSFNQLNRLISQTVSSATSSIRHDGNLNIDLQELTTNLVVYPQIHFVVSAVGPLYSINRPLYSCISSTEMTLDLYDTSRVMTSCNPRAGLYLAC